MPSEKSSYAPSEIRDMPVDDGAMYELHLSASNCFVDMHTCQVLVKTWSRIAQSTGAEPNDGSSAADDMRTSNYSFKTHIESVHVLMLEDIEVQTESNQAGLTDREPTNALLKLSLEGVDFRSVLAEDVSSQKLSIHKLYLDRGGQSVVSFFEDANMQESMMTSTVILNKHDVILSSTLR